MLAENIDDGGEVPIVVYARRYRTELASRKQFADYGRWVEREDIDGTSAYRFRLEP